jgi:hypothetical protein
MARATIPEHAVAQVNDRRANRLKELAMQLRFWSGTIATAFAITLAPVTRAHHGWAGQGAEQIRITGKVHQPVRLAGPHATMQVLVDGKVWDVTLAPASRTEGAGLKADTFAVGDTVTVQGNRNNDPDRFEIKTVRVSSGGKNYDVYPDRIK